MALSYPLIASVFADKIGMLNVRWQLKRQDEISGLGNGQILAAELGPPLWMCEIELEPAYHEDADEIQALIEALDGSMNTFYMHSQWHKYPKLDPWGTILGSSTPTIHTVGANMKSMRIQGLPNGYQLSVGDFLSFDYSGRRAFHRVVEAATAATGGITGTFEIRPHFRTGVAVGQSVTLKKAAMKAIIVPDSFDPGDIQAMMTTGMSFACIQVP